MYQYVLEKNFLFFLILFFYIYNYNNHKRNNNTCPIAKLLKFPKCCFQREQGRGGVAGVIFNGPIDFWL